MVVNGSRCSTQGQRVGKNHDMCPVLQVHGTLMESVTHDTYLGDIISSDGRNTKNVKKRISKGNGISTQIVNLLIPSARGEYYIEIALLLRESMFINGILTNVEIWYSITKEEMKELEDLDKSMLRKILQVPFSTPSEAFFSRVRNSSYWCYCESQESKLSSLFA